MPLPDMQEREAIEVATYNPPYAIIGWLAGSRAEGRTLDAAIYQRALDIQRGWGYRLPQSEE